jgi:hypothetical protein
VDLYIHSPVRLQGQLHLTERERERTEERWLPGLSIIRAGEEKRGNQHGAQRRLVGSSAEKGKVVTWPWVRGTVTLETE